MCYYKLLPRGLVKHFMDKKIKLISLNVWGGTLYEPFLSYIQEHAKNTDIFCFQEVFSALFPAPLVSSKARMFLFEELQKELKDFSGFFQPRSWGYDFNGEVNFPVAHGLAIFVRQSAQIKVLSVNSKTILEIGNVADKFVVAQIAQLAINNKTFGLINFHGLAQPGEKLDTTERIIQSEKLKVIWDQLNVDQKVLCGDFNLMPETQSVKMLEESGKNLIKEFDIKNTRNEISWNMYNNKQYFADYTFTSQNLKITSFKVPYNEVSDHLPMELEFEI